MKDWDTLCSAAMASFHAAQEAAQRDFQVGAWERFEYDVHEEWFGWFQGGNVVVEARLQVVGSFSMQSGTWLWAWANPHLPESSWQETHALHAIGQTHHFPALVEPQWEGDPMDGWTMAAIARHILQYPMVYRIPWSEEGAFFVLLHDLRWADEAT